MQITGGYLKSRKIDSPKGSNVRPTLSQIRESIFSMLFGLIDFEESEFLDAFAGSGIMGFEAISRGFKNSSFIENDKNTFFLIKDNAKKLGVQPEFHLGNTVKILKKISHKFDVIYVDPPYQSGLYEGILNAIQENDVLNNEGIVILEHPKDLEINFDNFNLIKQKTYSDKCITLLQKSCLR